VSSTIERVVLTVPGISCGHCQRAINEALEQVAGVRAVAVEIPTRRVRVDYDPEAVGVERLTAILAEEEYPVAEVVGAGAAPAAGGLPVASGCSCRGSGQ
jgi:copper chaperone CopZ